MWPPHPCLPHLRALSTTSFSQGAAFVAVCENLILALRYHIVQPAYPLKKPVVCSRDDSHLRLDTLRRLENNTESRAPTATERPEEICVLALICNAIHTVGRHYLELHDTINTKTVHWAQDRVTATL